MPNPNRFSSSEITKKRILFVTVGSTLFPALTNLILSSNILSFLSQSMTELVVQYGQGDPDCSNLTKVHQSLSVNSIRLFRYTNEFSQMIKESDFVVSHAGSGSILSVLRSRKPLLVIPNQTLMDDHQSELAHELSKHGYLLVTSVDNLLQGLERLLNLSPNTLEPFPEQDRTAFKNILDDTAGYT
ncbi:hypothetical protein TREMEDRAFT_35288 [Tremella mesenterica DSM 1558]|uniref:uncharacterized protein n=1 Tax=Tremella mesenterica (strain ATCC 24925 / CBS 8224 / DSM 1558 / NBRC 9311 / NRRL Y-6157 / RJB 2259-6 / UBC 559-6) TaxID=578456 RepID=UPI00032CAE17|nr:uncharacterized protein TREMEDRAFT_35288 [Tremella mesenterica DSM 1558]EIW66348.1 hypothetical protein TREMEDRAFT_35288 [Tremella mesenterica DSM 1558]